MNLADQSGFPPYSPREQRLFATLEIGLILAIFFIHAGWPVPEVNETHYLAKAKHYWSPQWCARDFFLSTADAHQVFYWTCGWLTRWLSLPACAWIGRLVCWSLLAWSWRRLSVAVLPVPLAAVLSAALFVAGTARMHMAGEWIIGGFEAKGLAYVFVLLAMEAIALGRWRRVWPLLGAASAFHVVVGAWAVVAAGVAWLAAGRQRAAVRTMIGPLALGFALSLPGLLPAFALSRGVDPAVAREASRIYVFERLPHHLLPQMFAPGLIRRQLLLWLLWGALCAVGPGPTGERRLRGFVAGTIGIALFGLALSPLAETHAALAAGILRYYWFRLSDIAVPAGVALAATCLIVDRLRWVPRSGILWLVVAIGLGGWHLEQVIEKRWRNPHPPADDKIADLESWREICSWVAQNTPEDALFITPRYAQSFRWYANRAEVVNRKDIPQDAAGIVRWWVRMNDVYRSEGDGFVRGWHRSPADQGSRRLEELGERYSADYVIADADHPLALEQVSPPNRSYAVYRLPHATERSAQ